MSEIVTQGRVGVPPCVKQKELCVHQMVSGGLVPVIPKKKQKTSIMYDGCSICIENNRDMLSLL